MGETNENESPKLWLIILFEMYEQRLDYYGECMKCKTQNSKLCASQRQSGWIFVSLSFRLLIFFKLFLWLELADRASEHAFQGCFGGDVESFWDILRCFCLMVTYKYLNKDILWAIKLHEHVCGSWKCGKNLKNSVTSSSSLQFYF